jgi:hypothetical protein
MSDVPSSENGARAQRKYDVIFIGTSMICVLEAVYRSICGKSVLMIDQQSEMGGAWVSLELFGLHDVENAIHYLLPDPHAFDFMKNVLNWEVILSPRKYRAFALPFQRYWTIPYDFAFGRLVTRFKEYLSSNGASRTLGGVWSAVRETLFGPRQSSYYVRGGTPEMLSKVKAILTASNVEVRYSSPITHIHIDNQRQTVEVSVNESRYFGTTIIFTHGSRLPPLTGGATPVLIEEKLLPRPAIHLLVRDDSPSTIYECIFTEDPLIKYVHDVTRFAHEAVDLLRRKKLFVLALHPHVTNTEGIYEEVLLKLQKVGMIGSLAVLEGRYWQDIYLPRLDDQDLEKLKTAFGPQVEYLKTDNFSRGVGYHAQRWATKIGRQNGRESCPAG